ncbi:hypothetical protein ACXAT3_002592 [Clostridium sporogenes]
MAIILFSAITILTILIGLTFTLNIAKSISKPIEFSAAISILFNELNKNIEEVSSTIEQLSAGIEETAASS